MVSSEHHGGSTIFRSLATVTRNQELRPVYAEMVARRIRTRLDPRYVNVEMRRFAADMAEPVVDFTADYFGYASRLVERTLRFAQRIRRREQNVDDQQDVDESLRVMSDVVANIWTLLPNFEDCDFAWLYTAAAAFMSNHLVRLIERECRSVGGRSFIPAEPELGLHTLLGRWAERLTHAVDNDLLTPLVSVAIASIGARMSNNEGPTHVFGPRPLLPPIDLHQRSGQIDWSLFGGQSDDPIAIALTGLFDTDSNDQVAIAPANDPIAIALTEWLRAKGFQLPTSNSAPGQNDGQSPSDRAKSDRGAEEERRRNELLGPPPELIEVRVHPLARTRDIEVWYATDRAPADAPGYFGKQRSVPETTFFGQCTVYISAPIRYGSATFHWWHPIVRWFRGPRADSYERQLNIADPRRTCIDDQEFCREVHDALHGLRRANRRIIVHIHGFNTTFDGAIISTAKSAVDLGIPGLHMCFSWPSKAGGLLNYRHDNRNIAGSEEAIASFLKMLCTIPNARAIHVIAHSMGGRGLTRATPSLALKLDDAAVERKLHQVVLAAPDIDADLFREKAQYYARVSRRVTMYVSSSDLGLRLSSWLRDAPRAGYEPPITAVRDIDTVDVSNVNRSAFGHSYYLDTPAVIGDMYTVVSQDAPRGTPPTERTRIALGTERTETDNLPYWQIRR